MIFIAVKFLARPERAAHWLEAVADFTTSTRAEPGNVFFEWSRSIENPDEFVLLEAFRDGPAGEAHVNSDHFKAAMESLSDEVAEIPQIVNFEIPAEGWGRMAELQPRPAG